MADNGTPEPFDAQPGAERNPSRAEWDALYSGQSRRKFLRNALIGSAAATAVVGTATTLIVTTAGASPASVHPKITKQLNPSTACLSPQDRSTLCLEMTSLPGSGEPCFGGGINNGGEHWLFFTIRSVAVGNYTAEVTQSANGGPASDFSTSASSSPFQLKANGTHVTFSASGPDAGPLFDCPNKDQLPGGSPGGAVSAVDPVAVDVTGSTQDVQVAFHIVYNDTTDTPPVTITFNATLTGVGADCSVATAKTSVVTPCQPS